MTAAQRVFSFSAVMGVFFSKHQFVKAKSHECSSAAGLRPVCVKADMPSHCDGLIHIGHVQQSKNCITESSFEKFTGVKHLFSCQIRFCNVRYSVWFQVWSEATPVKSAASHSTQWHSTMHICRAQSTKTSEWIPLMFIYSSFTHQTTCAALAKANMLFSLLSLAFFFLLLNKEPDMLH